MVTLRSLTSLGFTDTLTLSLSPSPTLSLSPSLPPPLSLSLPPSLSLSLSPEFHPSILGLTGSEEEIHTATKAYRVYYSIGPSENPDDYLVKVPLDEFSNPPDSIFYISPIEEFLTPIEEFLNPSNQFLSPVELTPFIPFSTPIDEFSNPSIFNFHPPPQVDHTIIMYLVDPKGEFSEYFGQNRTAEEIAHSIANHMLRYHSN